jgi:hypothetical protein
VSQPAAPSPPTEAAGYAGTTWGKVLVRWSFAGRGVVTGRPAGQDMQLQGLPPVGVRLAEGHPVGQGLDVGPSKWTLNS